jgi:O-Antigen ligase
MKELIVILAIAGLTFWLAKPIALRFSADADFVRRRNVWFTLTIIAFLSPNFWIFAFFAVPFYIWIGRKDSNPIAAYLLLMHVVPPVSVDLPAIGVSQLFSLDNYRLLSFCVLIPVALRARRSLPRDRTSPSRLTDLLLLAFVVLHSATFVPPDLPNHVILPDSLTNLLRRVFLDFVDILVLYYAVSRSCNDRNKIVDAQAAFCLSSGIMAVVATLEHFKGWLLYTQLAAHWDPTDANYQLAWLLRGDSWLRAQASAGHALSLGFLLAVAFGFWLYLQSRSTTLRARLTIGIVFWLGMIATFSRGPWIGAVLIYLAYSALKPRAISRLFTAGFLMAIVLGLASLSPIGEKLMTSLHVTGGQPDADFIYRQRLLDRTLDLVQAHPLFGDPLAMQEMEDLRQGQGIIDIVDTYVGVLLFHGWVGLALFLGFVLSALMGVFRAAKTAISVDADWALLGFNISACMIGILFMIADCSLIFGAEKMFYLLIALAAAYARQSKQLTPQVSAPDPARRNERRPLDVARAMPFADCR